MSGVGKGVTTSSLGLLLKSKGFRVTAVKIDPYINVDAGTMNPTEHGEVFVTTDGDETDQDTGNYERFLDTTLYSDNYMTTGRVYQSVIERERAMGYGGKCVEVVPHVPQEIIRRIENAARKTKSEIVLIEVGGTVGEYQNILFLEAARMMKLKTPRAVQTILVSYLPVPTNLGEMKTKPTQYAVRTLNSAGIQPDMIVCRGPQALDEPRKEKIATHCGVAPEDVISAPDVKTVYDVPLILEAQHAEKIILKKFGLKPRQRDLKEWRALVKKIHHVRREVRIAVVGKYFATGDYVLSDSYISVIEALKHAGWANNVQVKLEWLSSEEFEHSPAARKKLASYAGIVVPGGFGTRGVEGNIAAIRYARENKIPFFGLCYGLQLAVIEFSRHVAGLHHAHTEEVNPKSPHPVIHFMPEQANNVAQQKYGGTMRLGAYRCTLKNATIARRAYGVSEIIERHRHRYELNNEYRARLEKAGLVCSGVNPDRNLVEIVELPRAIHPWFLGVQFHPEFLSRPLRPHPLFKDFIRACRRRIKNI